MLNLVPRYCALGAMVLLSRIASAQIPAERKYDPDKLILRSLETVVHKKYGEDYRVSFHIMDSLCAHSTTTWATDPYGTLKGRVLFSAWRPLQEEKERDSIITGMFKDGLIIWDDYPGSKAGFGGGLLLTQDINNDGEVDILRADPDLELTSRQGSGISYLWILSWNGTRGKIINDIDRKTGRSMIISIEEIFDLISNNRNGVLDIKGEIPEIWQEYFPKHRPKTLPSILYTWNGTKYGYWPKTIKAK